jgi:branched-chain amino acid transport system substrate-binding protein
MKKIIIVVFLTGILSLITMSFLGSGKAEADPGVTDNEILIGVSTVLTGGFSADGVDTKRSIDLFLDQINGAGGIHGRKLKVIYEDDAYNATKGVAAVRKLIELDKVFCIIGPGGSPPALAARPIIEKEGVPTVCVMSLYDTLVDPHTKYLFQFNITSYGETEILCDYIKNTYRSKKAGVLVVKGEYGASTMRTLEPALKKRDITVDIAESAPMGSPDYTTQWLRIKAANPDFIILALLGRDSGVGIRQARELGLTQKVFGTSLLNMVGVAPTAGKAIEGVEFVCNMPGSPDFPTGKFKQYMDAFHAKYPEVAIKDMGTASMMPYGTISCVAEAMRRAGKDLTREKFLLALESLRDYDTVTTVPITFTSTDHRGMKYNTVLRYDSEGRRLFVSGPLKLTSEPPVAPAPK